MSNEHSTCTICNSQFKTNKNKSNKFCNMTCYRVSQRRGDYKRGSEINHTCTECNSSITGKSHSTRRNGEAADNIFCDRACYDLFRSKLKSETIGNCLNCEKKLSRSLGHSYYAKYCNHSCKLEHKKSKDRNCISCGVWFSALKIFKDRNKKLVADNSRKTCSTECYINNIKNNQDRKDKISTAFTGDKHPNWQGGTALMSRGFRGYEWKNIRLEAIKRDKFRCVHCGMNRDDHYEKYNCDFNINHIKPFYQFGGNTELANKMSNLETLCKSCHTKADWKYRKENQIQLGLGF